MSIQQLEGFPQPSAAAHDMDTTPIRRSGRQRLPSAKYSADAFGISGLMAGVDDDQAGSDEDHDRSNDQQQASEDDMDVYHEGPDDDTDDEYDNDDDEPEVDGREDDVDEDFEHDVVVKDHDSDLAATPDVFEKPSLKPRAARRSREKRPKTVNSRQVENRFRGSKEVRRLANLGPLPSDQQPALKAQLKWSGDACLPSRQADTSGYGGFHLSYYYTDAMQASERSLDWSWWSPKLVHDRQSTAHIDETAAAPFLATQRDEQNVVLGPYGTQREFTLGTNDAMNLNIPFQDPPQLAPTASDAHSQQSVRHGWLLNLGRKIESLDWAPNQDSERQYLAVAANSDHKSTSQIGTMNCPTTPFTAESQGMAAIQIWGFATSANGSISNDVKPVLVKVICTDWGKIRSITWCPVPRESESGDSEESDHHLGLLAGIWSDGSVRVMNVSVSKPTDGPTEYVQYKSAFFQAKPPETLATCFAWLSASAVVVGCANGCIAIWQISQTSEDATLNIQPSFHSQLQTSYIQSITTAYPSRPHIIFTTSTSGYVSLTDLEDALLSNTFNPSNTAFSPRTRVGRSRITWCDWAQMAVSVDDSTYLLQGHVLRRFGGLLGLSKFDSACSALAIGTVHPFVMAGTVAGSAVCTNPLRRSTGPKASIWNQIWFTHEWRPERRPDTTVLESESHSNQISMGIEQSTGEVTSTGSGIVRILESFRAEQVRLGTTEHAGETKGIAMNPVITVYEKQSAVTAMGWNPNIHVGGWCAAGMASGLLRVEDVAYDSRK